MTDQKEIVKLIPGEKRRAYSKVSPYAGIAHIFLEWLIIISAAVLCEQYFSLPLYVLVWALIGGRLLGLGILMHDAVHGLIHPNKKVNDFFGDVLCSWPLFISLRTYRLKHLAHHKWLNTDKDPDFIGKADDEWTFPLARTTFVRFMLIQLTGFGVFESFRIMYNNPVIEKKESTPRWYTFTRVAFYFLVIAAFVASGLWKAMFLYWIIPFLTWTQFANRLRRLAEHSGVAGKEPNFQTRTTIHGFLARTFLAPNNVAYHNEHHLFPGIPFYRLPTLHHELHEHDQASELLHTSHTYSEVLKEMIAK